MANKRFKKILSILFKIVISILSVIGILNVGLYLATSLRLTNDKGSVDKNDRILEQIQNTNYSITSSKFLETDSFDRYNKAIIDTCIIYNNILLLNKYYPLNASKIFKVFSINHDLALCKKMLGIINNVYLPKNHSLLKDLKFSENILSEKNHNDSIFAIGWMNSPQWNVFKNAVLNEKKNIDSASKIAGVESRLILCCLLGEQLRIYNQGREAFKKYFEPAKKLSFMTNLSYGVTGIKEFTASYTESNLKNKNSPFYLGEKYEKLLDYNCEDIQLERMNRLKNFNDRYYSYLYVALILKQIKMQWERAGYDISERPEILATLYNLGFWKSVPSANPKTGGAVFIMNEDTVTFGGVVSDFYYSGELFEEYPYWKNKWPE